MRASGQASRSPDVGAYEDLGGRCKIQLRLNAPIIFFGPEAGTISTFDHRICSPSIRSPAWNRTDFCTSDRHSVSLTAERLFRLQGTHVIPMEPHDFCTSDRHYRYHSRPKDRFAFKEPMWFRSFFGRTHNRAPTLLKLFAFMGPTPIFFFEPKLERNRTWETSLGFFLYLPPSIGLLLTVRSRFFCTRYRV